MADGLNTATTDNGFNATSLVPALTTLLGAGSQTLDIQNRSKAILQNMDSQIESFAWSQNVKKEQLQELDRAVGDKMTERGVQTLVTEARPRAGAAETGTAGGTTAGAVTDAYMQESLDMANLLRQGEVSQVSIFRQMQADRTGLDNRLTSLASGMQTTESAALSTLSAGLAGFNTGLNYLGTTDKESVFDISKGVTP